MALVKLGGLAQDVRGTLNGSVFSRNRGGAYIRSKVSPVQPVSPAADRVREVFKACSERWSAELDDTQRSAWNAFASVHPFVNVFGDSIILSGIAMFNAVNQRVRLGGGDWIDDPPLTFIVEDLGTITATITGTGGDPSVAEVETSRVPSYPEGLYIFVAPPTGSSRRPARSDFRLINTEDTGVFTSGESLVAALKARFPDMGWSAGAKCAVYVAALNLTTGAISNAVALNVVVS